jgi:hypothetical protein
VPVPATIDATPGGAVLHVCNVCGSRDVRTSRHRALHAAAEHQLRAHNDERAAQQLRWRADKAAATRR